MIFVINILIIQVTCNNINEYTQVRSLTNAMFVIKLLIQKVTYKDIKEYTQMMRSLTHVMFVIKLSTN